MGILVFEIVYFPPMSGVDPAFWFGNTERIEVGSIKEAHKIAYEKYGDECFLRPLNEAAKKADLEEFMKNRQPDKPGELEALFNMKGE